MFVSIDFIFGRKTPAGLVFTQNSETTTRRSPQYRMEFSSASLILIQDTRFQVPSLGFPAIL